MTIWQPVRTLSVSGQYGVLCLPPYPDMQESDVDTAANEKNKLFAQYYPALANHQKILVVTLC
ncbi:MAG: hypothetical protein OES26_08660 [Gammaproteobacteria bacterium]|nr:hypothetical protein [Gammaproteobacteria bacterium]